MSNIIQKIREMLSKYPDAHVEHDDSSITVLPSAPDGFAVRLNVQPCGNEERYTIWYNGSHEEVANHENAAKILFAFGLSTGCRMREYTRAGWAYRWVVEAWSPQRQRWEADWDVVNWLVLLLLFWSRPTIRYLQNRFIYMEERDSIRAA